ncbi:MAG: carboxymuconolactone decarboxylase family protein [Deferrisomatales bacterium]|nr:carboxymuconolactone decarboxylase family protein [Deferrisomatales bacterium]
MKARYLVVSVLSLGLLAGAAVSSDEPSAASTADTAQVAASPDLQTIAITRRGSQPLSRGPADYFTGDATIHSRFRGSDPARVGGAFVLFEPGARTAWHLHPLGQTLTVTAGTGWVQQWEGPVQEMRLGDIVWIPPEAKHWHGATATTRMEHLAVAERLDGKVVEWMEKVSDAQYVAPVQVAAATSEPPARPDRTGAAQPTRAQQLLGGVTPKLAQLTDGVLYGDVWERPQLSKRDRSLVTVAALIALYRPDQLRSHLSLAQDHGVTRDELAETITHLAFCAGWPNAVTAVSVAKEIFQAD